MALSALDMFSIGIGPSSSHTVGPMRAAIRFTEGLRLEGLVERTSRVRVELFGSLGATGQGHGSDKAIVLGLEGNEPDTVDTGTADQRVADVFASRTLQLDSSQEVSFDRDTDLIFHKNETLPAHPNGMIFRAFSASGGTINERTFYSVGGGFVIDESAVDADRSEEATTAMAFPFYSGSELLEICKREQNSISDVMLANEMTWRPESAVRRELLKIWAVMQTSVRNGCTSLDSVLPGALKVPRRAPQLLADLETAEDAADPLRAMDWVNLYALAVNEENASGGRVVTAPTNGAAGIVPAVLHYYVRFVPGANDGAIVRFLLTAAAIGILFKRNASISGADVGCQGEIGSACAMAAAGLCEILGGTPEQVENAAEIGIEHNLGLTCDPIGGLVQIPCIERNAIASIKAINAARMALRGNGSHYVSLDAAIKTMRDTGADMSDKYKETARGGLAVNVIEC